MHRHPLALLSSLYAAQGLPFGFFTLALPVLMREAGWSLTAIGLLQLLALPWLLKFHQDSGFSYRLADLASHPMDRVNKVLYIGDHDKKL